MKKQHAAFWAWSFVATVWFWLVWYVAMPAWCAVVLLAMPWVLSLGLWYRLQDARQVNRHD